MISIGTIGLIKAVDTFDPAKGKRFASYASRCIENELRMDLRRGRRTGVTLSLQEPLEADGQLTLADTLPESVGQMSYFNANDGTCEGVDYLKWNCFTVQFHPEANGGPKDTEFLFDQFVSRMLAAKGVINNA
jgi:hypothetical protein